MMFCPECGSELKADTKFKQHYPTQITQTCANNHLWDVWENGKCSGRLEFGRVELATCQCGETMPARDMHDIDDNRQGNKPTHQYVCPKCYEIAYKAWRMDKENSFARLEVTPVKTADKIYYVINSSITIRPYPNPFMYGGSYGGGTANNEQELEKAIQSFNEQAARFKENGMEKIEIIRHDETIRTQQIDLVKPVAPVETAPNFEQEPSGKELGFEEAHDPELEIVEETPLEEETESEPVQPAFTGMAVANKRIIRKTPAAQGTLLPVD